ncbi:MAG: hypothetical protein NZ700_12030 [Gemmataceae bacterium]|nr:hypothetical protein [Gemmataceae bacterium]MDW8263787.1 radical SAM protein [Gemmataceae bacterium]
MPLFPRESTRCRPPLVERRARCGPVLHRGPSEWDDVLSLNLTAGCFHRCAFCCARGSAAYPGDDRLVLYERTAEQLDRELAGRRRRPRQVYISPATDPFPPLAEVQDETARVVEVLARWQVTACLVTRGFIRPSIQRVLERHRRWVQVTVAMTTLDRRLQHRLEPWAAPPRLRLRQLKSLHRCGVAVRAALEPLIPDLTDTRRNLAPLLQALAEAGVRHVTAGYLFLRSGIRDHLAPVLGDEANILASYDAGPLLRSATVAAARYLPKARRQRGYAGLMALAAEYGIQVTLSSLTNPDFHAGPPPDGTSRPRLSLALLAQARP